MKIEMNDAAAGAVSVIAVAVLFLGMMALACLALRWSRK